MLTEPVPDVLETLGWTGSEAIVDSRLLRALPADDPARAGIAFGWGGGVIGLRRPPRRSSWRSTRELWAARAREGLVRFFPELRNRAVTHAWGGPIDVSPTHLPIFGSRGRVHHGHPGGGGHDLGEWPA